MSGIATRIILTEPGASADIGAVADTAVIDPTAESSLIAALKGLIKQLQGDGSGEAPVTLATSLSSEYDTIDFAKMSKGGVVTAHEDIDATTTSDEIDTRGFNTLHVSTIITGSGTWTIGLYGSSHLGGTFVLEEEITGITADKNLAFPCGSNYIKIKATETVSGATVTVYVTPYNSSGATATVGGGEPGGATATIEQGASALYQGNVVVPTPGTRVQLSADQPCREITVVGDPDNTGYIYVGNASVSSSAYAVKLAADGSRTFKLNNINILYIDAEIAGEVVSYGAV